MCANPVREPPSAETVEHLKRAGNLDTTEFDYIIVGSGAGGGPLACRLALADKRVLLIEAGQDPAKARSRDFPEAEPGEIHDLPGYHAASNEDQEMSWQFSVRHYADDKRQQQDHKYDATRDADGKGGIFYPRSSGIGGCTGHHAMIVVRPNDQDWDDVANLTNDDSWSAGQMQPYFAKFEKCLYLNEDRGFLPNFLNGLLGLWRWLVKFFNPRAILDEGSHGTRGWQPTSLLSTELTRRVLKTDKVFTKVLLRSAFAAIEGSNRLAAWLKQTFVTFGVFRQFDPNDRFTRDRNREGGVYLVPIGTGGNGTTQDEEGRALKGRRAGVREFILSTKKAKPEHLIVASGMYVTEVLFDLAADGAESTPPRAVGVRVTEGDHLYAASPLSAAEGKPGAVRNFYVRKEVILSGGSFNTPQLLMLSGIGDRQELQQHGIKCRVHLPGVGKNLQDRYEVSVVSELQGELKTLKNVSYVPGDPDDPERALWKSHRDGLYTSNGGVLVVLQRSKQADGPDPDLFTFGAPAAFRGYYWRYSRELFRAVKGAVKNQHNLWTWVILKAYTRNNGGTVRLRSAKPFETPEICFHSFDEGNVKDWQKDVDALVEAIESMRRISYERHSLFGPEIQPAGYLAAKNEERRRQGLPEWTLGDWIKNEAWGHHACGTCRIGSDVWRSDTAKLVDKQAVLDSRFRVHGVQGLRVVDASVFPKIPGYFILAPIFMVSEKAADVILEESKDGSYPETIRAAEAEAVARRRDLALVDDKNQPVVGLALSGGGIRSAIFNLGILQSLAEKNQLRNVDYLSTVSGGSFAGGFLGRLFHRPRVTQSHDPCGRVQDVIKSNQSAPIRWLRSNSNYLFATGTNDWFYAIGIFFRNILAVHLLIGALLLTFFGTLVGVSRIPWIERYLPSFASLPGIGKVLPPYFLEDSHISAWWWVPAAALVLFVIPMSLAFWLAPKEGSYRAHPPAALAIWLVMLIGAYLAQALPDGGLTSTVGLVILVMTWIWQEASRRGLPNETVPERMTLGVLVRNRLSRGLGESILIFFGLLVWVIVDSLARAVPTSAELKRIGWVAPMLPFLPLLHSWAEKMLQQKLGLSASKIMRTLGLVLGLLLLFVVDLIAHTLFDLLGPRWAWACILVTLVFSLVAGRAFDFLNFSSLHSAYASRITRCFLGASNSRRVEDGNQVVSDIQIAHRDDDIPYHQYRPEAHGGPLHLLSVCINETIDASSQRALPERKGTLLTLGAFGVSIGRRYFAKWTNVVDPPQWLLFRRWLEGQDCDKESPQALEAVRLNADPNTFHPLGRRDNLPAVAESLTLGRWIAISGASFSTGRGRATSPLESLFLGLINLRLGYWWDSGVRAGERPGRFPGNFWRRLKEWPGLLFNTQRILLWEWAGRFHGPSHEFWNLTDGGHVDNSAVYELVRRKVPLIICTDATRDLNYVFEDLAELARAIGIDFGAEIDWTPQAPLPPIVVPWLNAAALGTLDDLKGNKAQGGPGKKHAALARIKYPDGTVSQLIYLKSSLVGDESIVIRQFAATDGQFPQNSTDNQFYDEKQWESYRRLGHEIGGQVFK